MLVFDKISLDELFEGEEEEDDDEDVIVDEGTSTIFELFNVKSTPFIVVAKAGLIEYIEMLFFLTNLFPCMFVFLVIFLKI